MSANSELRNVPETPTRLKSKLRLTNPWTQNFISGMCVFLAVGIYLAITGLGAGAGKQSAAQVAMTTNAVLYGIFTICGFFGGSVMNTIGPKLTFLIGIFGYPFYASGLWYYDATEHEWYPIFSGAVLGVCAALLWTVAGFIQFSYGEEGKKGQYIAIQTVLLAIGSSLGSSIPLGINFKNQSDEGVPTAVYATFVSIMASALFLAGSCIIHPSKVIREDGTHLAHFHQTSFREEFIWCLRLLQDWRIVTLLLPMFATEIMLAIIPTLNAFSCNLRTRSFNNFMFQIVQIPTAYLFGLVLDKLPLPRMKRGLAALGISFCFTSIGWVLVLVVQTKYNLKRDGASPLWDWHSGDGYPMFLAAILFHGIIYVLNQMIVMWTLSALTNNPYVLARYAGLYKGMLSCGLCVTFGIEAAKVSYLVHTVVQTVVMMGSFPVMAFILINCVKDTKYSEEEDVVPPKNVQVIIGQRDTHSSTNPEIEQEKVATA